MEHNMIGGRLCYFWNGTVFCWQSDMIKILDELNTDWWVLIDWRIVRVVVWLWFDFDCCMILDQQENIDNQEAEKERYKYIRKGFIC